MVSCLSIRACRRAERGYVMLTLLLMVSLLIIAAATVVSSVSFDIKRDREEDLIHRGVQYSRAIRTYYKKFGRYPVRIEDLESTNNLRFLRKRYKDPMNCQAGKCQDFKLLHFGEVKLAFSGGTGGGTIPGANAIGTPGGLNGQGAFGQQTAFGQQGGFGQQSTFGGTAPSTTNGDNTNAGETPPGPNQQAQQNAQAGDQPESTTSSPQTQVLAKGATDLSSSNQTVFGGGPIVGVVSASKKQTIREFNHKRKYSEWQFIYDPGTDRGGLLSTPNQPPLIQSGNQQGTTPGQPNNSSPFGNQPFGNQPFGQTPNPNGPGMPTNPPPTDNQQQPPAQQPPQ